MLSNLKTQIISINTSAINNKTQIKIKLSLIEHIQIMDQKQQNNQPIKSVKSLTKNQDKKNQTDANILWIDRLDEQQEKTNIYSRMVQNPNQFQIVANIVKAQFKKDISNQQRKHILNGVHHLLVIETWRIFTSSSQNNDSNRWYRVFDSMEEAYCKRLNIEWFSENQNLLIHLVNPKFTNLNILNLACNSLKSIESLSFIDAPQLKSLYLEQNLLTCLKPLNKLRQRCFRNLNISKNSYSEIQIGRLYYGKAKDQGLFTFFKPDWLTRTQCTIEDIRFIAKLQRGKSVRQYNYEYISIIKKYSLNQDYYRQNRRNRRIQTQNQSGLVPHSKRVIEKLKQKFNYKIRQN